MSSPQTTADARATWGRSLRLRLLAAAALSITTALVLADFGLSLLFERHVARRLDRELDIHLHQLTTAFEIDADGQPELTQVLAEPRFSIPLSGLYWQIIDDDGVPLLRSRSLWDEALALPPGDPPPGSTNRYEVPGPAGDPLIIRERVIVRRIDGQEAVFRLATATDRRQLIEARKAFAGELAIGLLVLGAVILAASWVQVAVGLQPLEAIRRKMGDIRAGRASRLVGAFPIEVEPLADEVNGLLDQRDQSIAQARSRAGDLAHGLKTPLSILAAESRALREAGSEAAADALDEQIAAMNRHVERELARTKTMATRTRAGLNSDALKVAGRMVDVMKRLPGGDALDWQIVQQGMEPNDATVVAVDEDDLTEILGNILDNARKWARASVRVTLSKDRDGSKETDGSKDSDGLWFTIDDDGPGIPRDKVREALTRGTRLDESVQGSGLGLAIVRDIFEAYGTRLDLATAPTGGLSVRFRLPQPVAGATVPQKRRKVRN